MAFESLQFYNFRNLKDGVLKVHEKNIFLVGENGQGKSNFLEAVYLLSFGSSFRVHQDRLLVKKGGSGQQEYSLKGRFSQKSGFTGDILLRYTQQKKQIYRNDQLLAQRKELINTVPSIVFCHGDIEFVKGSPDRQRWFFNQIQSQFDSDYLDCLIDYSKVLKNRNILIKDRTSPEMIEIYNYHLAQRGERIMDKRQNLIDSFNPVFQGIYQKIAPLDKPLTIEYRPSWKEKGIEEIQKNLQNTWTRDMKMGTTTSGPHRDRFRFTYDGYDYTQIASTGQLRLMSLVLRVAQAQYYQKQTQINPVLLLDDVMLELDSAKREAFIGALPQYDQAFFTFLPQEPYIQYTDSRQTQVFMVHNGEFSES